MYRRKRAGFGDFHPHLGAWPQEPTPSLQDLREANAQLVLAALKAQESAADATEAHRQQLKHMAIVAHELRNPLTPLRIAAGLLINRNSTGEIPVERLQVIINGQVTCMTRLIDDLLDASRLSTSTLRIERSDIDLGSMCHLAPEQPASQLSGGELTRVALAGAWLQPADWLILDEPGNHLDALQRERLRERIQDWAGGLLLVSHDRSLLADVARTLELSAMGLADYGGGYAFYEQARDEATACAQQALEHQKAEQRRDERERRARQENLARRQARTTRQGKQANQAAILLGGLRQASQVSTGKRLRELHQARDAQRQRIREATDRLAPEQGVNLLAPTASGGAQRKIAMLEDVRLPFGSAAAQAITLNLRGSPRLALTGANGSGKSSLLKLLAGQLVPASGRCHVHVPCALLDQQLQGLASHASALQQLQAANPDADQAWLRTRLALLGLAGDDALKPSAQLSGGERLKAALACVLHARRSPELLLLDEPTNHLDLPSQEALEQMLGQYRGALIVASHDRVFLNRLQLDGRLVLGAGGLAVECA